MKISTCAAAMAVIALSTQAAFAQEASFHYAGGLSFQPEHGNLAADWRLTVQDDTLETVTFFLSAAFEEAEISGADVLAVDVAPAEGFGGAMMAYTLTLAPSAQGADRVIQMRYGGVLLPEPLHNRINTIDTDKIELTVDSFWMPFDSRFSSLVTAEINIGISGATSGDWSGVAVETLAPAEQGFRLSQTRPALDVAFTLMSRFERHEAEDYVVYDLRTDAGAGVEAVTGALDFCTAYLNELAGRSALPSAAVTITDRESAGYSRATLIALTDIRDSTPEALTQFICHELGHYWSRGNPMTVENWLNESFADYVAIMGMRDRFGEAAFEARLDRYRAQISGADTPPPAIWTPGTEARPPYLVAYRKGPLALAALEAEMGREAFEVFMAACMQREVATTPEMLAVLESVAGPETRRFFEAELAR